MGGKINFGDLSFKAKGNGRLTIPEKDNKETVNYAVYSGSGAVGAVTSQSQIVVQAAPLTFSIRLVSVEACLWVETAAGAVVDFEVLRLTLFNSALQWNFQPLPGVNGGAAALIVSGSPYQGKTLKMDFSKGLVNAYAGTNFNVELTIMKSVAFVVGSYTYSVQIAWQPL